MRARRRLLLLAAVCWAGGTVAVAPAHAAPCCGGNAAAPAMITGDDRAQVTATFSGASVVADADARGRLADRPGGSHELTGTARVEGAWLLSDLWQAGVSVPLVVRDVRAAGMRPGASVLATRLGDVRVGGAYEALPEWEYSSWKPRGHVFAQLALPTGTSIHESRERLAADVSGQGFYAVTLGAFLQKRGSGWDAYLVPEAHVGLDHDVTRAARVVREFRPGWGASLAAGFGVTPWGDRVRLGLRVQPLWSSGQVAVEDGMAYESPARRSWDAAAELSYVAGDDWSLLATYVDQRILGGAESSALSRVVTLGVRKRWAR